MPDILQKKLACQLQGENSVYYDKAQISNHPMAMLGLAGGHPQGPM